MSTGLFSLCMRARFGNRMRKLIAMKLAECCSDDATGVYIDAEAVAEFAECEVGDVLGTILEWNWAGLLKPVEQPHRPGEMCFDLGILEMLADGDAKFALKVEQDGSAEWLLVRDDGRTSKGGAA